MGFTKINIWFFSDGCRISEHEPDEGQQSWQVAVMHCDGSPLTWCDEIGKPPKYVGIPAPCGHAEIEVPPGCYIIRGGESLRIDPHNPKRVLGNHMTDHAVVIACCDEQLCVNLFVPSAHNCVFGVKWVLETGLANNFINAEIGKRALTALTEFQKTLEPSAFDRNAQQVMGGLLTKMTQRPKK
jgi:hypothetical protein